MTIAHIFDASETPANVTVGDFNPLTVGLEFVPALNGFVTGVRYWRSQTTAGQQTVALWDSADTLLASRAVTGETASGWQEQSFTTPVPVTGMQQYMVGVFMGAGGYAHTPNYFTDRGRQHPQGLVVTPAGEIPGLFNSSNTLAPPNAQFNQGNYWVDVAYSTDAVPVTLFPDVVTPVNTDADNNIRGTRFRTALAGKCYGVRHFQSDFHTFDYGGLLYSSSGAVLASALVIGRNTYVNRGASWQCFLFPTPVGLLPGQVYMAASWIAGTESYGWDPAAFNAPLISGVLTAPANSDGGNALWGPGTTDPTAPGSMPSHGSNNNYWVDLMFVPDAIDPGGASPNVVFLA